MDCSRARHLLTRVEALRLCDDEVEAAILHARGCPDCAHLVSRTDFEELCRALRRKGAPERVREGVLDRIALERVERAGLVPGRRRSGAARNRIARIGAGVVALVLVAIGTRVDSIDVAPVMEEQARREATLPSIASTDPSTVAAFAARELSHPVDADALAALRILGAEVCDLEGTLAVVVTYAYGEYVISHYLSATADPPRPPVVAEEGGAGGGPAAVTWSRAGVRSVLVGRIDPRMLLTVGRVILREQDGYGHEEGAGSPKEPGPESARRSS